jgi:hypothetical protein
MTHGSRLEDRAFDSAGLDEREERRNCPLHELGKRHKQSPQGQERNGYAREQQQDQRPLPGEAESFGQPRPELALGVPVPLHPQ